MSKIVLGGIANFSPPKTELFAADTPEFIIATRKTTNLPLTHRSGSHF